MTPEFKIVATENDLTITADLPELRAGDIEMVVEGRFLRIDCRRRTTYGPFTSRIKIPVAYDLTKSRARYLKSELRIDVPKDQEI